MRSFFAQHATVVVAAVILGGFLLIAGTIGYVSQEGRNRRHDICVQVQDVKRILYREHTQQLRRSIAFLRKHPYGIDGFSRGDILNGIHDQRVIVAETKPQKCPE